MSDLSQVNISNPMVNISNPMVNINKPIISLKFQNNHKFDAYKRRKRDLTLYAEQQVHCQHIADILTRSPYAFDLSMLGTGKTFTTSQLYLQGSYHNILTIMPTSVKTKWDMMNKTYGIKQIDTLGYCELRSVKFKQPKHGLLIRRDFTEKSDDDPQKTIVKTSFTCARSYLELVERGLLLVLDEMQNIKNISDQLLACQELIRPIRESFKKGGKSRVILLSGSPIDKKEQVIHIYKALGIMKSKKITCFNPALFVQQWSGMTEIQDYMYANFPRAQIDRIRDELFITEYQFNARVLYEYCYALFQRVMKHHLSHAMPPHNHAIKITKNNAFYNISASDQQILYRGIELLSNATNFNSQNDEVNFGHNGIEAIKRIQSALLIIETGKIGILTRIAKQTLEANPNQKVVICVNYTATINDLVQNLSCYHPLRLNGSVSNKARIDILEKFQAPNNTHRLIIGNLLVCSTGIDLDDQDGRFPRLCLVNPNYSTIILYQLSHRFHRAETKSDSTIHFVFGKGEKKELSILNALAKKTTVMKETTQLQVEHGVIFPGEYPEFQEGESPLPLSPPPSRSP